ncbi:zinc-dependent alcohol dehydrogenase family protein [Enterovirga rhinocerotis]|uniref:D-arabinose 1-dehydrogenase-like Zn-dependent alcohol dehydrogenase n=1 Tax=Enterovirga rhinocerotis TaxID=1339210 RepID=A0A4R7BV42_9HYPH|nr:zinc-binding dehydrogenase [Enterovirga rhinocerotis]TDR88067.1 D-arabinose 1-dehydrogenase-like Zn-dependent alcohol dehydrogenase [Enterovirga rhinocerotis]
MRAVSFAGDRTIEMITLPDPTPGPKDVVLEMKASGICGSDLKFYRAPRGGGLAALGFKSDGSLIVAGHEPCGIVVAAGSEVDSKLWPIGSRVMVHHYHGCECCRHCRTGWSQMCEEIPVIYGVTGHGGHAPYMKVPASTLVRLPEELTFSTGAAISCGTGTAYGALVRLDLSARDTLVIIGQGPVGLSGTQLAAAMGARVIAVDVSAERAERAKAFGATDAVDASTVDPVEAIMEITGGLGASKTLDTSGTATGRSAAIRSAAKWGSVCFVGEGGDVTIEVSPQMIRKQLEIVASWTFSTVGQADCARFVAEHEVAVDDLFTDRWTLDRAVEAYQHFDKGSSGKAVFEM